MNIWRKYKFIMILSLILSLTLSGLVLVEAENAEVYVQNPNTGNTHFEFHTNTTTIGAAFNVTILISDILDLRAFQVMLSYNSTLINATGRAWLPTWDSEYVFYGKSTFPVKIFYYNDTNYGNAVLVGDMILGTAEPTFNGSGLLAIIEFEIVYKPTHGTVSCDLNIDNEDTQFLDDDLDLPITVIKTSGFYRFTWVPRLDPYLEVKPPLYESTEPEMFNVTVWANNVTSYHKLVNVTFSVSYDATLLDVTQVFEGSFLAGFGSATFNYTIEAGNVTVLNYLEAPTIFPEGDGMIATITFQGVYQDKREHYCDLKLNNIQLLNSTMSPIPFSPPLHSSYRILPATSLITISVSGDSVVVGSSLTINGTIQPVRNGAEVMINYRIAGSTTWENLSRVITDGNSRYTFVWTTNETGYFDVHASWLGDDFTLGAESEIVSSIWVKLKESSSLTINIDPGTTVVFGNNLTITGTITPTRTDVNVTVEYRQAGETDWILLEMTETDSESYFSYTWIIPEIGEYEVRASWEGDASYEGASETKTVKILETAPVDYTNYLIYALAGISIAAAILGILYFKKFRKQ